MVAFGVSEQKINPISSAVSYTALSMLDMMRGMENGVKKTEHLHLDLSTMNTIIG